MTSSPQIFNFEGKETRMIQDGGELWFVAKDVAQILEYSENSNPARLFSIVPEIWKWGETVSHPPAENRKYFA